MDLENEFYNYDSLADWLRENAPAELVICPKKGVTVEMVINRLGEIADREWYGCLDAMGEDA